MWRNIESAHPTPPPSNALSIQAIIPFLHDYFRHSPTSCYWQAACYYSHDMTTTYTQQTTIVPRPPRPFFSLYKLAQVGFFLFGIPKGRFGSVDVTNQCNLRCDHCYFFQQDHTDQWSLEQWRERFDQMKTDGFNFFQCTWVGGEPLLRPEIIELGRRYFKYNTVTTNGSVALPDWKDVSWYISVDGGRQQHELMRNTPGLYDTIKQTIEQSDGLKITIAYCITSENFDDIAASLEEWHSIPKVRNMVFSFITPIRGQDDALWLEWHEKDRILDLLKEKKKLYGDFIVNTERALSLMKSGRSRSVTDRCPFAEKSFALGPLGIMKEPCMLGPKADCDRCGCVVPFYLKSLTDRNLVISDVVSMFTTKVGAFFHKRIT
jgi:Fe-coproporphyrin III synthase